MAASRSRSSRIYAGINGFLDAVPVGQVPRFQDGAARDAAAPTARSTRRSRESGDIADETEATLEAALEKFASLVQRRGGDRPPRVAEPTLDGIGPGLKRRIRSVTQHAQDHAGDGARRGGEAAPGADADRGDAAVRRHDARADRRRRPARPRRSAACRCWSSGRRWRPCDRAADRRPRARRRLQRAGDAARVRARAGAAGRGRDSPLARRRQEGTLHLCVPPAHARRRVHRLHRPPRLRRRAGDRAPRGASSSSTARSTASSSSTTHSSLR